MKWPLENSAISIQKLQFNLEVTFQQKLEGGKRVSLEHAWQDVTGRGHSWCKGPEVGAHQGPRPSPELELTEQGLNGRGWVRWCHSKKPDSRFTVCERRNHDRTQILEICFGTCSVEMARKLGRWTCHRHHAYQGPEVSDSQRRINRVCTWIAHGT